MTRPHPLPRIIFIIFALSSAVWADEQPPNIVLFLVDDMGWQDTSHPFHTEKTKLNRTYRTPNLERLARQAATFTNAYACAVCSPSRVSLLTGQNAARHKVTCWTLHKDRSPEPSHSKLAPAPWNVNGLQPLGSNISRTIEAPTLPALLKQSGYHTIHVGKAHFGAKDTPGADPKNLGFEVNIAGHTAGGPGSYHGDKNFSGAWRNAPRIWDVPGLEKYHGQKINLTEALTREAIAAMAAPVAEKKPFFLYMSHYTVHAPWEDDRRFVSSYQGKGLPGQQTTLASMIEGMDKSLGDIRAALTRLGVADNTVVIFMSDNGSPKQCPRNIPLRGHKISAYEGGSRVPFVIHYQGLSKPNTRYDTPIIIEDLFPTILSIAGVKTPPDLVDGQSILPILGGETTDKSRPLIWHYPNYYDQPAFSSIRIREWKLIYWHTSQKSVLYNLKTDIGETKDLCSANPEIARELSRKLGHQLRSMNAAMPISKATGRPIPYPN